MTLDSGERQDFDSGMRRDTQLGKPRYDLIDRSFLRRWAELMGRGAEKYGERNWELASSQEELNRFKASALRHMMQWLEGEEVWETRKDEETGEEYQVNVTEDHAAAVAFNVAAVEFVKGKTNEALKDGWVTLAEAWAATEADEQVNPGSDEPDRALVYQDSGEDGYPAVWTFRDCWGCQAVQETSEGDWVPAGDWEEVKTWEFIWPWTRIA